MVFTVLGFTILNYGTKLETAVSASIGNKFGPIGKELNGLDIRILTITILLSLVFLGRALVDTLYAWNLLKSNLHDPYIGLVLILFTELAPSLIITQMIGRKHEEENIEISTPSCKSTTRRKQYIKKINSPNQEQRIRDKLITMDHV